MCSDSPADVSICKLQVTIISTERLLFLISLMHKDTFTWIIITKILVSQQKENE